MTLKMTAEELNAFLARVFPQMAGQFVVEDVAATQLRARLLVNDSHVRSGGTLSGPSMFGLADVAMYAATLARVGPKALAVTTNCSMDFMRKPAARQDLIAETRLLKLGRVLAVGDVHLRSVGEDAIVARATLTYSIPPV